MYRKATTAAKLPHECVAGFLARYGAWIAYIYDNAVIAFGTVIENALNERVNRGSEEQPDMQPRYTLNQLLDADFRLAAPETPRRPQLAELAANPRSGWTQLHEKKPEG